VWNDAYLAAFAQAAGLEIITFDQGFSQYDGVNSVILAQEFHCRLRVHFVSSMMVEGLALAAQFAARSSDSR